MTREVFMKRNIITLIFMAFSLGNLLKAQEIILSGNINLNWAYFYEDSIIPVDYSFEEISPELSFSGDNYTLVSSFKIRLWNNAPSNLSGLSEFSKRVKIYPYELYAEIDEFLFSNIDVRIGRQRIAWGTADRLNPTDNLNPYDLQDPFNFGERIPSDAILLLWYLPHDFSISGVFLPHFSSPLLPETSLPIFTFFDASSLAELPEGLTVVKTEDTIIPPEKRDFKNSSFAAKVSGNLFKWDFSFSFYKGYDYFPLSDTVKIYPVDSLNPQNLNMDIYLSFPSYKCIGFDFAGELFSIGLWGEAGLFMPDEFVMKIITTVPTGNPLMPFYTEERDSTILSDPYLKFTTGLDYTFKWGTYVNVQWNHGFFFERGEDLHDYLVGRIEQKLFEERFIAALNGIFEIAELDDFENNYGYSLIPELTYKPTDNVELTGGVSFIDGEGDAIFSRWKNIDQFYLKLKGSF